MFKSQSNKNINVKFLIVYSLETENVEDYYEDYNEEDLEWNLKTNNGGKLLVGKYVI